MLLSIQLCILPLAFLATTPAPDDTSKHIRRSPSLQSITSSINPASPIVTHPNMHTHHFNLLPLALLLLAATAAIPPVSAWLDCPPGKKISHGRCAECPVGTYQAYFNPTKCIPCRADTYTPFTGVVDRQLCIPCPEDSIAPPGSSSCSQCPTNRIGSRGKCVHCRPGTIARNGDCAKCSPFSIAPNANTRQCTRCEVGHVANAARTACVPARCPPGMEGGMWGCARCPAGMFRTKDMERCAPCPRRTSTPTGKPRTFCEVCPAGSYLTNIGWPNSEHKCRRCPRGQKTVGAGKASCRTPGKACPDGTFEDSDGDCDMCDRNFRLVGGKCLPCPPGEVSFGTAGRRCFPCKSGQVIENEICVCPKGTTLDRNTCRKCPAGTFHMDSSLFGSCEQCPRDSFSRRGASECTPCPKGHTSDASFGKTCEKLPECPHGFILPPPGTSYFASNVCISGMSGCPEGLELFRWYRLAICMNRQGKVVCPDSHLFDGMNRCVRCWPGSKVTEVAGQLQCHRCGGNSVSPGGLSRSCEECPNGFSAMRTRCVNTYPPGAPWP